MACAKESMEYSIYYTNVIDSGGTIKFWSHLKYLMGLTQNPNISHIVPFSQNYDACCVYFTAPI